MPFWYSTTLRSRSGRGLAHAAMATHATAHVRFRMPRSWRRPVIRLHVDLADACETRGMATPTSEWKPTACILCECNCGLEVQLGGEDGRHLVRLRGDRRHPS